MRGGLRGHNGDMSSVSPVQLDEPDAGLVVMRDKPWTLIVWNDPVNLMSYVAFVFRTYFGYDEEKSTRLMLQVHHDGKAAVASGSREEMERHVQAMHEYGLWATLEKSE